MDDDQVGRLMSDQAAERSRIIACLPVYWMARNDGETLEEFERRRRKAVDLLREQPDAPLSERGFGTRDDIP